jgi:hypothetical protein
LFSLGGLPFDVDTGTTFIDLFRVAAWLIFRAFSRIPNPCSDLRPRFQSP